jgi:hypothetical protein
MAGEVELAPENNREGNKEREKELAGSGELYGC